MLPIQNLHRNKTMAIFNLAMRLLLGFSVVSILWSCQPEREAQPVWKSIESSLQERFIQASDGDTILIPAGHFLFTRGLSIDGKNNLVLIGAGEDSTFLSFKNQKEGAQGLLITNGKNIIVSGFTIEDAKGDNLKVSDVDGLTLRNIRSRWTAEVPSAANGAYALYPVLCKRVLIEYCEAIGSSDAGIYVGQSDSVIIRNNKAWNNVAGIESENSKWVEIYGNEAWMNSGGLLVFDLPGLTQYGHHTKIFKNIIRDNNHENFAMPGNVVASIPPGTGVMILATHDLEMFDNDLINNRTVGTGIISYELVAALNETEEVQSDAEGGIRTVENNYKLDSLYNPYPYRIALRNNRYSNEFWFPSLSNDIGFLFLLKSFLSPPDIAYDGIKPPDRNPEICLSNNQGAENFLLLDAAHDFEGFAKNPTGFDCSVVSSLKP